MTPKLSLLVICAILVIIAKIGEGVPGTFDNKSDDVSLQKVVEEPEKLATKLDQLAKPDERLEGVDEGWVLVGKNGEESQIVYVKDVPEPRPEHMENCESNLEIDCEVFLGDLCLYIGATVTVILAIIWIGYTVYKWFKK
jgi:hypothetical protein